MSYEIPGGLPSLVCPLIVNPAFGNNKKSLYELPYPGIDRNLDGFHIQHLHWVGWNATKPWQKKQIKLTTLHEYAHESLVRTPYLLAINYHMAKLYELILSTGEEELRRIEVPLRHNQPRNRFEEEWQIITAFKARSRLIEEVYAIRASLLKAEDFIDDELAQKISTAYKVMYEERIPGFQGRFQVAYDAFDLIVRTLGETAATAVIHYVLHAGNPDTAFWDIVWGMCTLESSTSTNNFVWKLSPEKTGVLASLSFVEAYNFFNNFLEPDPDDSRYGITRLINYTANIKQEQESFTQYEELAEFYSFFLDVPAKTSLHSQYDDNVLYVYLKEFKEAEYSKMFLILEAILQQLATGKGVVCPLWKSVYADGDSCGWSVYPDCDSCGWKVYFEKVWSATSHNRSRNWKRWGCLAEENREH